MGIVTQTHALISASGPVVLVRTTGFCVKFAQ